MTWSATWCAIVMVMVMGMGVWGDEVRSTQDCVWLDSNTGFRMFYSRVGPEATVVNLTVSADVGSAGWFGVAKFVSSSSGMTGGDFVVGWVTDGGDGVVQQASREHANGGVVTPVPVGSSDISATSIERVGSTLSMSFTKVVNSPGPNNLPWGSGPMIVGYAIESGINPGPDKLTKHHHLFHNKVYGTVSVDLSQESRCVSSPPPPPPPAPSSSPSPPSPPGPVIDLEGAYTFSDGPFTLRFKVDRDAGTLSMSLSKPSSSGWVGMCFTQSAGKMGPGSSFIAFKSSAVPSGYVVSQRLNPSDYNAPTLASPSGVLAVEGQEVNGEMTISFVRSLAPSGPGDVAIQDKDMEIVWAEAPNTTPGGGTGDASSSIVKHSVQSSDAISINFFTGKVTTSSLREKIIRAHGVMMLVAWAVLVPAGIAVARYAKDALGHNWFRIHVASMSLAVVLMLVAFVFAVWYASGRFGDGPHQAHKVCGLVTFIVGICQPILGEVANLTWKPDRKSTPLFPDQTHWWLGRLVSVLALVTSYLGIAAIGWAGVGYAVLSVGIAVWVVVFVVCELRWGAVHHNGGGAESKPLNA